jgi:hypothetical protein
VADYSPYQQKIIKRYYQNFDAIKFQRLSDLTTELYLAEGKKSERLWMQVFEILRKLEFPATRVEHLAQKRDPAILASIIKELDGKMWKAPEESVPAFPFSLSVRWHNVHLFGSGSNRVGHVGSLPCSVGWVIGENQTPVLVWSCAAEVVVEQAVTTLLFVFIKNYHLWILPLLITRPSLFSFSPSSSCSPESKDTAPS